MKYLISILLVLVSITLFGQKRLELLETNISRANISPYTDSYLWTKNWWLTNRMLVDTSKGGNAISTKSKLSKAAIDSLSKEFSKFLPSDLIRFGNLIPRINFLSEKKSTPYIKASVYDLSQSSTKLLGQVIIEFGSGRHNNMADILNIIIVDPKLTIPLSFETVNSIYERKATEVELDITPPQIKRD